MSDFLEKLLAGLIGAMAGLGLMVIIAVCWGEAKASYGFPPVQAQQSDDLVLMHLEYTYGGGATIRCASPNDCYRKRLDLEARGAEVYCRRITLTVNGQVRGVKDYFRWRDTE